MNIISKNPLTGPAAALLRVRGNLQPGHWVSQSDIVPELVRGLPSRG